MFGKDAALRRMPALGSRNFRLIWIGQTISAAGSMMQFWAVNWHLYALTHRAMALGLLGLFRIGPVILFSLIGGTVADAHDRRRIMLITQSCMAAVAAGLAVLTVHHLINQWYIYGLMALAAAAQSFDNPARQSLIPNLVPRTDFPNAAALNSTAMQVSQVVGPLLAGQLIARGSLFAVYAVNAVSFGAVIVALLMMDPRSITESPQERTRVNIKALFEGLAFVRGTPILVWTIALDFLATFFSSANTLLPIFARDILHVSARGYGALAAAQAVGSFSTGAAMTLRRPVHHQGLTVLWAVAVFGVATVVFGISRWFLVTWIALAVVGGSDTVSTILRQTIRQLVSPDRLRGRMTAVNMVFFMGGPQLGEFEAGAVANWLGAPFSVITGGVACLLVTGWVASQAAVLRAYTGATIQQESPSLEREN